MGVAAACVCATPRASRRSTLPREGVAHAPRAGGRALPRGAARARAMVDAKLARILKRKRLERRKKRKDAKEAARYRPGHSMPWIEAKPSAEAAKAMAKATAQQAAGVVAAASGTYEVCLKYVPYDAKEDEMKEFFSACGPIDGRVRLLMDRQTGKCKGIGWVTFETAEGMANALANDGCEYGGRHLSITPGTTQWRTRWDQPKPEQGGGGGGGGGSAPAEEEGFKVCLKYLPASTQDAELKQWLESACGRVLGEPQLMRSKDAAARCKGMGWLRFATEEGRERAVALSGAEFGGKKVSITVATTGGGGARGGGEGVAAKAGAAAGNESDAGAAAAPAAPARAPAASAPPVVPAAEHKACLKYLPTSTTEGDLKAFFERLCGPVVGTPQILRAPNGKVKGMGWIVFASRESLDRAVARTETEYNGKKIGVSEATTKR